MIHLDTSVLVAALITSHRHHEPSVKVLLSVIRQKEKGCISQHTLAELYSSLTNYPSHPRLSPAAAESLILENILVHFRLINLAPKDYRAAIRRTRERKLGGGIIYDALILQSALKAKAKALYTWNTADFQRLSNNEIQLMEPAEKYLL